MEKDRERETKWKEGKDRELRMLEVVYLHCIILQLLTKTKQIMVDFCMNESV